MSNVDRVNQFLQELDSTLEEVNTLADSYNKKAANLLLANNISRALIAVLGVPPLFW